MERDIFDYTDIKLLDGSMALIPYFGGESTAVHAHRMTNIVYYMKTLQSMRKNFTRVVTFVQNDHDLKLLSLLPGTPEVIKIECEPIFLPIYALRHVQANRKDFRFKYIFYTEADHILYTNCLTDIAEQLDKATYIMPWRFTRIHPFVTYPTVKVEETCPVTRFDGKTYEIRHYVKKKRDGRFVTITNMARAFSGCWLAKRNLFMQSEFKKSDGLPIEHACFSLFDEKRQALRTYDPYEFFVDHLSGFEQTLRDHKDMNIMDVPGGW